MEKIILQLTNSKGRIVFLAMDSYLGIKTNHELGGGYCNHPEECYLSAACCWADNPSCKITGTRAEDFKAYCLNTAWGKHLVK